MMNCFRCQLQLSAAIGQMLGTARPYTPGNYRAESLTETANQLDRVWANTYSSVYHNHEVESEGIYTGR